MTSKTLPNGLRDINRFITTTNDEGKAIYSDALPPNAKWQEIGDTFNFFLGYTTEKFPACLDPTNSSTPEDIEKYSKDLETPCGLAKSTGTVCRIVDFGPGLGPMHRTISLDFGIVLEGTMECHLDSGEVRTFQRGDICVQRATSHAWKNVTEGNGWARMVFVLQGCEAPEVKGGKMGEFLEYDIPGVKTS
ncbi:hypothetical protein HYFRA_00010621 [Hymenoscyphus fraxineus]|uniref:Uncharacterized protein n=1 Tax=Hymenoscyphus fraxineus TaxID=746836 RepID=A0A9N9PZW3_9HELO|nr:hypothetical protein HYFRA_00010621 [Hymenoscyphus fraxineus]